jgi:hypothetical protein
MIEIIVENDYGDSVVDVTGLEPVPPACKEGENSI